MQLDRDLQRAILERLKTSYPETVMWPKELGIEHAHLTGNLFYLREHGLITARQREAIGLPIDERLHSLAITADGLDFLESDGGISAILNTVTVRFEEETLRALLAHHVASSSAPPGTKEALLKQLRAAPAQALQTVVRRLTEAALDQLPNGWQSIQSALPPMI